MSMHSFSVFEMDIRRRKTFGKAFSLIDYRFERDNGQVPQMQQARNYVSCWEDLRQENMGMLFWGMPGNGKTFAAACIANALIEMPSMFATEVRMVTLGTVLMELPAKSPQEKMEYVQDLVQCDLLILDDFGMERQTDYAREQVFNLIDGRYLSRLPLIVTTNLSLQELKNPKTMSEKRIYDRILQMCVPVCFDGESLRRQIAAEKLKRYQQLISGPEQPDKIPLKKT